MGIFDWIKSFFSEDQTSLYLDQKALEASETRIDIEMFAIMTAINLISNAIAKCEFKTFVKGDEVKRDEYYLWNIEPNVNQNSSQFLKELVSKLLLNNECLVIGISNQLIVADSFTQNEFAVYENTFANVTKGTMRFGKTFKMSEVLYFKNENVDITKLLTRLIDDYSNLVTMAVGKYKKSGGRKGILDIDATAAGNKDFQARFDELMNVRFKRYFESENAVLPLHKGFGYDEKNGEGSKKSVSEIGDIRNITEEIFDRVAQAFKIPPAVLKGNIADVEKSTDNLLTFGVDPLTDLMSEEINRKRYGKVAYLAKSYMKIDTTCIKHKDIFAISESFDKLIASGGYSIDELRAKTGDEPLNTEWSVKHWMTKNYQDIEFQEGGENLNDNENMGDQTIGQ